MVKAIDKPPWDTWPPMDLVDWITWVKAKPDPEFIIPGMLPFDATCLMSGRAKIAWKTWMAFHTVLAVASGVSPVSYLVPTRKLKTLVIELEGPEKQTANRWEWLSRSMGDVLKPGMVRFMHRYRCHVDDPAHLYWLSKLVQEEGIKFCVIDTLAKANTGDENSVKDMSRTMEYFDDLRRAMDGGSIMYLHHLRKPNENFDSDIDDDVRGSSALSGFYDVHWALRKASKNQPWIDLTVRQSDDAERYFRVEWKADRERGLADLQMAEVDLDNPDQQQLDGFVALLQVEMGYSLTSLSEIWGVPRNVVKSLADRLVEEGTLVRKSKKLWLK